ncbi:23S rRNA (uracil(1939)-C(5))-methyltransferase RlmD [Cloacibacillus sp. An23]|uniref:23S rRNA (uracil(1939)-C(5))-methyltransferase RlmD n=1 Tax=Cloacibacillus sp. An23 TaxID=1965591 RepID=UPI000B36F5A2|nr:23S rRNA (uracil(1939)-C(5))-methyltransferase RlmD [Cloacibacillus sp. An23]OUO92619.1 23S rRNA (uracil(1939)-C(5))-methyltransferase RlmD [Cloacibacillus sp. An23]
MRQGDILNVTITGLNNEGEGVVRAGDEGFVLFVPGALPGESAEVRLVTKKKNYGVAKVLSRGGDSPARVNPRCPLFGRCGGCQLQHISYEEQLAMKHRTVEEALRRIGGFDKPPVAQCVPSPSEWNYRNKASLPVQSARGENFVSGFYKTRSHEIVPYRGCPVLLSGIDDGVKKIAYALRERGFRGVREKGGPASGLVRHVVMRQARFTGEKLCAVIGSRPLSKKETSLLTEAAAGIKGLTGLVYNVNPNHGNFIWGEKTITIYGKPTITEKLGEYSFTFEASSFFQVNSEQTLALYRRAAALAVEGGARKILELYSGVGSLTAFLAAHARHVTAVESWQPAAKYIKQNAAQNGLDNIEPYTAQAEDLAEELSARNFDTVVLDPPRTGCDEKVTDAILKISPERVVYVSCNPATLARDAKRLAAGGYKLAEAAPFDMFPQTGHVETVALMRKGVTGASEQVETDQ